MDVHMPDTMTYGETDDLYIIRIAKVRVQESMTLRRTLRRICGKDCGKTGGDTTAEMYT